MCVCACVHMCECISVLCVCVSSSLFRLPCWTPCSRCVLHTVWLNGDCVGLTCDLTAHDSHTHTHCPGNCLCFSLQERVCMCLCELSAFAGHIQIFSFRQTQTLFLPVRMCLFHIVSVSTSSSGDGEDCCCPYDNLCPTVNHQGSLILLG